MAVASRIWRAGRLVQADFPLEDLDTSLANEQNLVWFDLVDPDVEVLDKLTGELNFSKQSVEDALAPGERPKARRQDHHMFVQAYGVHLRDDDGFASRVGVARISAFVVANGLITVRSHRFDMAEVLRRWDEDEQLLAGGVLGLLHGLLDVIVDGQFEAIQQLDDRLERLEDRLIGEQSGPNPDVARATYQLRRELIELRRVASPMRDVVNTVFRFGAEHEWTFAMRAYYEDLSEHVQRAAEWIDSLHDLIASIFETNLALNDARLNAVMKKLSAWAAIIAVPTLITGWFGMNVPYWGFGTHVGLVAALVASLASAGVLFVVFRRNDWL